MQLSRHVVSSSSDLDPKDLTVTVKDQPGPGGDCHYYEISNYDVLLNPSFNERHQLESYNELTVLFQQGNPAEGFNGITIEALLAICEHRLKGCQSGPFKCDENAQALMGIGFAIDSLHARTRRLKLAEAVVQTLEDLKDGKISLS